MHTIKANAIKLILERIHVFQATVFELHLPTLEARDALAHPTANISLLLYIYIKIDFWLYARIAKATVSRQIAAPLSYEHEKKMQFNGVEVYLQEHCNH